MLINLNNCFPEGKDGARGPLPKQAEFMSAARRPSDPKYIAYVGGVGSGKTLIGCITLLEWAVTHPGDYLAGRQFGPELKDTTYKTFMDICPPELIDEIRVADNTVVIKSVGGKKSRVLFRGLEEPDKHRSLNLSGFLIDEASQVSEEAFMLLQSRLRGSGLRKGILVTNPAGHDWIYRWWVKQDHMAAKGRKQFHLIMAPSTENVHLPDGYVESMLAGWSEQRVMREIYGSFDAFEGQIYTEFRRDVHVVQPFRIPDGWTRIIGADHGYRNPACWLWGAIDYDGDIWIYRELYEEEWLIEELIKGHKGLNKPGVLQLTGKEKIDGAYIDPSIKDIPGKSRKGFSEWQEFFEHLPKGFPLTKANNDVAAGIEKVKGYMKIREDTGKPRMHIFASCTNLIDEISKYRWKELRPAQQGKINEKEEPMKKDDHACDALRYLVMSRPDPAKKPKEQETARTSEYYLQQHIKKIKKPKVKDPWGEF